MISDLRLYDVGAAPMLTETDHPISASEAEITSFSFSTRPRASKSA
jgi:hypothetical protein